MIGKPDDLPIETDQGEIGRYLRRFVPLGEEPDDGSNHHRPDQDKNPSIFHVVPLIRSPVIAECIHPRTSTQRSRSEGIAST